MNVLLLFESDALALKVAYSLAAMGANTHAVGRALDSPIEHGADLRRQRVSVRMREDHRDRRRRCPVGGPQAALQDLLRLTKALLNGSNGDAELGGDGVELLEELVDIRLDRLTGLGDLTVLGRLDRLLLDGVDDVDGLFEGGIGGLHDVHAVVGVSDRLAEAEGLDAHAKSVALRLAANPEPS